LNDRIVPAAADTSERFQFLGELDQASNVAIHSGQHPIDVRGIDLRFTQQVNAQLQDAERLPPLVGSHPRELIEAFSLIGDRLRVQPDERFDGGL